MSKLVKIVLITAVLALAGIGLGWLFSRPQTQGPAAATPTDNPTPTAPAVPAAESTTPRPQPRAPGPAAERAMVTQPTPAPANVATNWEERIDEILGGDKEDREKARQMLELFPRVPADGQAEVAQHLANLTPNEDYAALAQYLTRGGVSEGALDVLMADVLNRPNSLKLPALLEVARDPQNPKATDAKDVLQLFLEEDFGTDWNAWQAKMEQWLKDNPD